MAASSAGHAGGGGSGGTWPCPQCTLMNPKAEDHCQMCDTPNPAIPIVSCAMCTAHNQPTAMRCIVCGEWLPHVSDDEKAAMSFGLGGFGGVGFGAAAADTDSWSCSACTFLNQDASADTCTVCGTTDPERHRRQEEERRRREAERKAREAELKRQEEEQKRKEEEEMERKRAQRAKDEVKEQQDMVDLYQTAYRWMIAHPEGKTAAVAGTMSADADTSDRTGAQELLRQLYKSVQEEHDKKRTDGTLARERKDDGNPVSAQCQVCYCDFDSTDTLAVNFYNCPHVVICRSCFQQYLQIKIRDKDVLPWIPCPHETCKSPITTGDLAGSDISTYNLYQLVQIHLAKHLSRNMNWVDCKTDGCLDGFLVLDKPGKKSTKVCGSCNRRQTVVKKPPELDPEFQKLIKQGKMRPCPKCQHYAIKDFGMCNVMECQKCGIYWNWRSKETGRTSRELKARSRANGSMWEPGELQYQQRLQREDPEKFRQLLEKNGIRFDPNYVRGSG